MDDPKIIDGRKIARKREALLKQKVTGLSVKPKVVSLLIGDDPASVLYTRMKQKKASEIGISFEFVQFSSDEDFSIVAYTIIKLNQDKTVHGIMIQLPLPASFLQGKMVDQLLTLIDFAKDVDGLTGKGVFLPAAVLAVMVILDEERIDIQGKFAVVMGTSKLVGLPIAKELKKRGALVSSCNSKTANIRQIIEKADILVSATGKFGLVTGEMVKEGVVVIDVGTLVIEDQLEQNPTSKVIGDVDFASVYPKASKITPVPGGVGPVTVISLLENVVDCAKAS